MSDKDKKTERFEATIWDGGRLKITAFGNCECCKHENMKWWSDISVSSELSRNQIAGNLRALADAIEKRP